MANDVEYPFMHLIAIVIFSLVIQLLPIFLNWVFLLLNFESSLYLDTCPFSDT